jgi:hypothetical protein
MLVNVTKPNPSLLLTRPASASRRLLTCASTLLVLACGTAKQAPHVAPRAQHVTPALTPAVSELYAAEEALRDVTSGAWEYLGTGEWHSAERARACAFRNQRVIVVNVYCTLSDTEAFRLEIFSPQRGLARIYAESNGPISTRGRPDYFTFMVESEPAPRGDARLGPPSLAMSFADLRAYDERRYAAYLPACYAGTKFNQEQAGCLGPLHARTAEWTARNRAFLQRPDPSWYDVIRQMRALAARYGEEPR